MKLKRNKIIILAIIAIAVVVIAYFGSTFYSIYFGCGFNDGPFKAITTNEVLNIDSVEVFQFSGGEILLDNRIDSLPPLIGFRMGDQIQWVLDMDVKNTRKYKHCSICKIYNLEVSDYGKSFGLEFTADWTYGHEAGQMTVKKKSAKNKFCLSW